MEGEETVLDIQGPLCSPPETRPGMSVVFLRHWLVSLLGRECIKSHMAISSGCLASGLTGISDTLDRDRKDRGGVERGEREGADKGVEPGGQVAAGKSKAP